MPETLLSHSEVLLFGRKINDIEISASPDKRHTPSPLPRVGKPGEVEQQLSKDGACFARIYGFAYEGAYFDLPRPMLFLVHGEGFLASEVSPLPPTEGDAEYGPYRARAVPEPSVGGVAQAPYQIADDMRVWSYDKADYTIRMDVDTGMFEDILLSAYAESEGFDARGMNARGMNARGMNARGMNARGMNARGMNARGMNARGGSD